MAATSVWTDPKEKQIINVIAFVVAFIVSVYLRKYFVPFIFLSCGLYLFASANEMVNADYAYLPETIMYWNAGNMFLAIGVLHFLYRILFEYKIEKK